MHQVIKSTDQYIKLAKISKGYKNYQILPKLPKVNQEVYQRYQLLYGVRHTNDVVSLTSESLTQLPYTLYYIQLHVQ